MELFHRRYGEGPPLVILHGLFGSGGNWRTLASRRFGQHFSTYTVDLRNHGLSPHSDTFDYEAMAADVAEFADEIGAPSIQILGHSMGGKVAMVLALDNPALVSGLVVADMSPVESSGGHEHILDALRSIDLSRVDSREEADAQLGEYIASSPVRQFLLKNLRRDDQGNYGWQMNLTVIDRDYANVLAPVPVGRYDGPTLFVRGTDSSYIGPSDLDAISSRFPSYEIADIGGAGHWVHADRPDEFADIVIDFLTHTDTETNE